MVREWAGFKKRAESLSRFEGLEKIGEGCMGEVYRAYDSARGEQVALKVALGHPSARLSVENEAWALARVRHGNVLMLLDSGVFGSGEFEGRPFVVTGIVEGEGLAGILEREGGLPWGRAREIMMDLCSALQAVHDAGLVHRDVKPENIIVGREGAWLADFGVSEPAPGRLSLRPFLRGGFMPGNIDYAAPEMINGRCDGRADIYSAGMLMRRMLEGRLPSGIDSTLSRMLAFVQEPVDGQAIGEARASIIARATSPHPEGRFRSASEMRDAMELA